uniref:Uncharacterized protein n=2 Tax=Avena sativa TaxID=4498 RepID=A0ACD5U8K9_AVESA
MPTNSVRTVCLAKHLHSHFTVLNIYVFSRALCRRFCYLTTCSVTSAEADSSFLFCNGLGQKHMICRLSSLNCEHVSLAGDVPRVDGQLAVARAFGDRSLKKHLSSDPHVAEEVIDESSDFLILASDGLWKVMTNQEAVDEIKDFKDAQAAAKHLTEQAVNRRSKDDISCVVVKFHC